MAFVFVFLLNLNNFVSVSLSQFIDGMTQVIHRLESHARTDRPINALKDSLEGNSDQFTQDMNLIKFCFKHLSEIIEIYTIARNH